MPGDYRDPGWFKHPEGTVAFEWRGEMQAPARIQSEGGQTGKTGELTWQFTKAGTFDFACLQTGHCEAGMKGQVGVVVVAGMASAAKGGSHTQHKY